MAWRTKASWREQPGWHWAYPRDDEQRPQYQHMAHGLTNEEPEGGTLKAGIYLPTAEGWELHQVYGDPPKLPEKRKLGL